MITRTVRLLTAAAVIAGAAEVYGQGCAGCGGQGAVAGCSSCGPTHGCASCGAGLLSKLKPIGSGRCVSCAGLWSDYCATRSTCIDPAPFQKQPHGHAYGAGCGCGGVGIYRGNCGHGPLFGGGIGKLHTAKRNLLGRLKGHFRKGDCGCDGLSACDQCAGSISVAPSMAPPSVAAPVAVPEAKDVTPIYGGSAYGAESYPIDHEEVAGEETPELATPELATPEHDGAEIELDAGGLDAGGNDLPSLGEPESAKSANATDAAARLFGSDPKHQRLQLAAASTAARLILERSALGLCRSKSRLANRNRQL